MLDLNKVREDFPMLSLRRENGKRLIYLDNAATSLKPRQVIDAVVEYYERHSVNVHRGIYKLSQEATSLYEGAREKIAKFIRAEPSQVVFTKNTTEGVNIVAHGLSWKPGDEVITTVMEHHSNLVPWQIVRERFGVRLRFLDITGDGLLKIEQLKSLITERTRLLAVSHISNVLGTINPVEELIRIAHKYEIPVLIDAAQSAPHIPINVERLGCDFMVFSGHKMLGPTGIGVLYIRRGVEEELQPIFGGGEMISTVSLDEVKWNDMPWRFEPGTPNVAGALGLSAAVDYLRRVGMENVRRHEMKLTEAALKRLSELEAVTVYGPRELKSRGGLVSFNVEGANSHDIALLLDELENIAVRSGLHCAEPLHRRLRLRSSVRASFYLYNTLDEVNLFCDTLERIVKLMA